MSDLASIKSRILVVDDEESMRFLLREVMVREGYDVETAADGLQAVDKVRSENFDLVIMDIRMPGMDGIQALKEMRRIRPHLVVLMITAHGTSPIAIEAIREGAYDYFNKPFELSEMRIVVRRALEKQALINHVTDLEQKLKNRVSFDRIIGQSDAMQQIFSLLEKVVVNDVTVLITGESGTGKELIAQAVHYQSARKSKPFVGVNCAAIPETLLESELFGHERGAFTGAVGMKIGRFEAANGGSIFLDEIGDMPFSLQSKLLRVLQEREVMRVGGTKPIKIDVRLIAATNKDLLKEVEGKTFREDLYFRLNVIPVHLPPLRKRVADIPLLLQHFFGVYNPRLGKNIQGISPDALKAMMNYSWPGNIRELENLVQRSMIMASGVVLGLEDIPKNISECVGIRLPVEPGGAAVVNCAAVLPQDLIDDFNIPLAKKMEMLDEEFEKRIIIAALKASNGKRQAAADLLGIVRKSLHNKMVKYNLFDESFD